MLSFKDFLKEEFLIETGGAGAAADSLGKERELGLGKYLNGGKHADSYRAAGKTPAEMHHIHSEKLHGKNYQKSASHKQADSQHKAGAAKIQDYFHKNKLGKIHKAVWTSQHSDYETHMGHKDPNNTADLIVHSKHGSKEHKTAISAKTGTTGKINYDNPGIERLSHISGKNLAKHTTRHKEVTDKHGVGSNHTKYKELRDSSKPSDRKKAADIKASSDKMNQDVAKDFHAGLSKKTHHELKNAIKDAVAPKTKIQHVVSHQVLDKNGKEKSHHIYDMHKHADEYLHHFKDLHVEKHTPGKTSVSVIGTHHKTGKKMKVASWSIYAGGRPANGSPRGATTLPSEHHKDIHYSEN